MINELLHVLKVFFVILVPYDLVKLAWAPPFPPPFLKIIFFKNIRHELSREQRIILLGSVVAEIDQRTFRVKKTVIFLHEALIFEIWKSCK